VQIAGLVREDMYLVPGSRLSNAVMFQFYVILGENPAIYLCQEQGKLNEDLSIY